ncbi:hypothetical protein [Streptomyces globisporus]|uniref:hypothetical protein n=1 Tax=Streptomyces globisporus TaxID=1908 RepID=UPI0004C71122|nr:hypothetical protein [Streptomyces globisporus]
MRVLLMAHGSRGDLTPLAGLAPRLRDLGAEVRTCAPPYEEFAELLAGVGAEHVPFGRDVRTLRTGAPPSDAAAFAAERVAEHVGTVAAAAEGCDALVASGLMPTGARSVAEKLSIRYVYAGFPPPVRDALGVVEKANHSAAQRWWRTVPDGISVEAGQNGIDKLAAQMDSRKRKTDGGWAAWRSKDRD